MCFFTRGFDVIVEKINGALLIGFGFFSGHLNAGAQNAIYAEPIIKEATVEWPEPHPDASNYLDYDPDYAGYTKKESQSSKTIVKTRKRGRNHFISATLRSETGVEFDVSLMIDTGASIVVLPESMMSDLGIDYSQAVTRNVQTVNGITEALYSQVAALTIGEETINHIDVAFIADDLLGGTKLLGMNVLNNYTVTLNDKKQTLTLQKVK